MEQIDAFDLHVTPHFLESELGWPPSPLWSNMYALAECLEAIRAEIGGLPILVNSAYRSAQRNDKVGGSSSSSHLTCEAADIYVGGMTPAALADAAERALWFSGWDQLILYRSHLHVGIGPKMRRERFRAPT